MPPNTLRHGIDAAVKALVNGADHAIVVVPKHFCCVLDCPGYPWKASDSRHPCGAAEPGENDDADRVPPMPLNVDGALSAEDGRPVEPHDLDFYDDEEWALSVGKPWHAYRCTHDYFRHPKPKQTGDCDP